MIAKTKVQKKISKVEKLFKGLTKEQKDWSWKNLVMHIAVRLKSGKTTCLDCGHEWVLKTEKYIITDYSWEARKAKSNVFEYHDCPNCKTHLEIHNTRLRKFHDANYYTVIRTFREYQVIMLNKITVYYIAGQKARVSNKGVGEIWIDPEGKHCCFGQYCQSGYNNDTWCGDWTLRDKKFIVLYSADTGNIFPKVEYTDKLKKIGIPEGYLDFKPAILFKALLGHTCFETLLKMGEYDLLKFFVVNYADSMDRYWPSLKICLRHKYKFDHVHNIGIWVDHIQHLRMFRKDLHSPKYIMPADLHKEHNIIVAKRRKILAERDKQKQRVETLQHQDKYAAEKGKFFGIEFVKDNISVKVIDTVLGFIEEGDFMGHCLFTGEYYKKKNSLIFSAQVDGIHTETVEVLLSTLAVAQARGRFNVKSEYHKEIKKLVEENIHVIEQVMKPVRKPRKITSRDALLLN